MYVLVNEDSIILYNRTYSRVTKVNEEIQNEKLKRLTVGTKFHIAIKFFNKNEYRIAIEICDTNNYKKISETITLDVDDLAEFNKIEYT